MQSAPERRRVQCNLLLDEDLVEWADREASAHRRSRSAFFRQSLVRLKEQADQARAAS